MPILTKLKEFLDVNRVRYEVRSHPTAYTAQEVAAEEHIPGREMAKVVMVSLWCARAAPAHSNQQPNSNAAHFSKRRSEGHFKSLYAFIFQPAGASRCLAVPHTATFLEWRYTKCAAEGPYGTGAIAKNR